MKYLPLLGALILSASPAIADDFLYLRCDTKFSKISKDLRANKIIEIDEGADVLLSKVDLINSRVMTAEGDAEWEEVEIVNGVYSVGEEKLVDGVTLSTSMFLQVDPPGKMTVNVLSRDDNSSVSFKVTGMCKEVDASVFEKALKESES